MLKMYNFQLYCNFELIVLNKNTVKQIEEDVFHKFKSDWCTRVAAYADGNKLRTYTLFQNNYWNEIYLKNILSIKHGLVCLSAI